MQDYPPPPGTNGKARTDTPTYPVTLLWYPRIRQDSDSWNLSSFSWAVAEESVLPARGSSPGFQRYSSPPRSHSRSRSVSESSPGASCTSQNSGKGIEIVCLCPSAHLNNCSDQVMDMAQVQQIYARLFTHIDVATASQAGLGRRRILLRAGRPPALRTPPASLSISTLPRPCPAALGTVLLHSAHIIHACPATKL
jgi:hypothetical protein